MNYYESLLSFVKTSEKMVLSSDTHSIDVEYGRCQAYKHCLELYRELS